MPETMSEYMPERMSAYLPESISDANRMPARMSYARKNVR